MYHPQHISHERYIQVVYLEYKDKMQPHFQIQFKNVDIDKTTGLNIVSHYQKVKRSWIIKKALTGSMKLDKIKIEKVAKQKNMILLKSRKENSTMIYILNYVVH